MQNDRMPWWDVNMTVMRVGSGFAAVFGTTSSFKLLLHYDLVSAPSTTKFRHRAIDRYSLTLRSRYREGVGRLRVPLLAGPFGWHCWVSLLGGTLGWHCQP
jgi:hypothetical protein